MRISLRESVQYGPGSLVMLTSWGSFRIQNWRNVICSETEHYIYSTRSTTRWHEVNDAFVELWFEVQLILSPPAIGERESALRLVATTVLPVPT